MKDQNQIVIIEQYLLDKLTLAERKQFEIRVQENPGLAQELERRLYAHQAIEYMIASRIKEDFRKLDRGGRVISFSLKRKSNVFALAIAASVLILIGAFFTVPLLNPSLDEKVMAYYEQPDYSLRNVTLVYPTNLLEGIKALEIESFRQAISSFSQIEREDDTYSFAQYLLGHAYFQSAEYAKAVDTFLGVIETGDLRYKEEAEWNALVSCLLAGLDCTDKFESIRKNPGHPYSQKVKILFNQTN